MHPTSGVVGSFTFKVNPRAPLIVGGAFCAAGAKDSHGGVMEWRNRKIYPCWQNANGGDIYSVTVFNDQIYAGTNGWHYTGSDPRAYYIIRWDKDNNEWDYVDGTSTTKAHHLTDVFALLATTGRIWAGGAVDGSGGTKSVITSTNGTTWTECTMPKAGTTYVLYEYDGYIYAGGLYADDNCLYKTNNNGSSWTAISSGDWEADAPYSPEVRAMTTWNDILIIGGNFTEPYAKLAAYDGSNYLPMQEITTALDVRALCVGDDNKLYVGVYGETYHPVMWLDYPSSQFAYPDSKQLRVDDNTTECNGLCKSPNHSGVTATGRFHVHSIIGATPASGVLTLDSSGVKVDALSPALLGGEAKAIISDGSSGYWIGGSFKRVESVECNSSLFHISSAGAITIAAGDIAGVIEDLCLDGDDLIVVGNFTVDDELEIRNVAIYDTVELRWAPVGHFDDTVYCVSKPDDNIWFGGAFNYGGGQLSPNLVVWNRGTATWYDVECGIEPLLGEVASIEHMAYSTTTMYLAGDFIRTGSSTKWIFSVSLADVTSVSNVLQPDYPVKSLIYTGSVIAAALEVGSSNYKFSKLLVSWVDLDTGENENGISQLLTAPVNGYQHKAYGTFGASTALRRKASGSWATFGPERLLGAARRGITHSSGGLTTIGSISGTGDDDEVWIPCLNIMRITDGQIYKMGGTGYHAESTALSLPAGTGNCAWSGTYDGQETVLTGGAIEYSGPIVTSLMAKYKQSPYGWSGFNGGLWWGGTSSWARAPRAIIRLHDGAILVGGVFNGGINLTSRFNQTYYEIITSTSVIKYYGGKWVAVPGASGTITAVAEANVSDWGYKIVIGGIGGAPAYFNGTDFSPCTDETHSVNLIDGTLNSLLVAASGDTEKVWMFGGWYAEGTGVPSTWTTAVEWDGDTTTNRDISTLTNIYAACWHSNQMHVIGYDGTHKVYKWTGSAWSAVTASNNLTGDLYDMMSYNGVLYVSGNLAVGSTECSVAKLVSGAWAVELDSLPGFGQASKLGLYEHENALVVCGDFRQLSDGTRVEHLAMKVGSTWQSVDGGLNGPVYATLRDLRN